MFKSTLPDVKGRSYTPKGVVSTIVYADNYDGKMHDMIDGGLSNLEEQAIYQGVADGIIGITITTIAEITLRVINKFFFFIFLRIFNFNRK